MKDITREIIDSLEALRVAYPDISVTESHGMLRDVLFNQHVKGSLLSLHCEPKNASVAFSVEPDARWDKLDVWLGGDPEAICKQLGETCSNHFGIPVTFAEPSMDI